MPKNRFKKSVRLSREHCINIPIYNKEKEELGDTGMIRKYQGMMGLRQKMLEQNDGKLQNDGVEPKFPSMTASAQKRLSVISPNHALSF